MGCFMKNLFSSIVKLNVISYGLLLSSVSFAYDLQNHNCDHLAGTWTGIGTLKWYKFDCNYLSVAQVGQGNPAVGEVSVAKSSGPFFCPNMSNAIVKVSCQDGVVTLKDDKINVAGVLSYDGNFAQLNGTLLSRVRNHPFTLTVSKTN